MAFKLLLMRFQSSCRFWLVVRKARLTAYNIKLTAILFKMLVMEMGSLNRYIHVIKGGKKWKSPYSKVFMLSYTQIMLVQVLIILSHHSRPFLFTSYKCFRSRIERTNYLHTMFLHCYFLLWYSIFYTFWVRIKF